MKRSLSLLPLLAGALLFSTTLRAVTPEQTQLNQAAWPWPQTYAATYALNYVTATVASSAVDLSSYSGVAVDMTSTTGAQVQVEWANDSTNGPWIVAGVLNSGSTPPLVKLKNYVRFRVLPPSTGTGQGMNALRVSLKYSLLAAPSLVTTNATPTPGIQPVSPTVSTLPVASGTLSGLTQTTQPFNLTSAAGISTAYITPHFRHVRGGTSVVGVFDSVTYSTIVDALNGPVELVAGASDKIYGPCFPPGTIWDYRVSGTAGGTIGYELYQCK